MTHFIPLSHPYTALTVAQAFFEGIIKLHGFPCSIVSDRDPVFTSTLWKELFALSSVQLRLSSTYRPQTDGQSEVATGSLESTFVILLVIVHAAGSVGFRGRNSATTHPTGRRCGLHRSASFMGATRHPSSPTHQGWLKWHVPG
jgi:hypothetical protein